MVGEQAKLEVLKFADDGFSFHWTKEGSKRQIKTSDDQPNTVSFLSVREEDFGHYQCEVKDAAAGKVLLTLYTALYKEETSEFALYNCVCHNGNLPLNFFLLQVYSLLKSQDAIVPSPINLL